MIKFFRHIRKTLISENKMGKYFKYAVGEIILVMIGILLALQVNTWNTNRKNAIKEQQFMERFKLDTEANILELNRIIAKSERTHFAMDSVLQEYKTSRFNLTLKELGYLLMKGRNFTVYQTSDGTVNDIVGSAQLDIITNDAIRYAIGSWQANLKALREWEKIDRETADTYRARLNTYLDIVNYQDGNMLAKESKEAMFNDRVFINFLRDRKFNPKTLNSYYKLELQKMELLLKAIENAL